MTSIDWHRVVFVDPDASEDVEDNCLLVEAAFTISAYHPATHWAPAEGGEVEVYGVRDEQSKLPLDLSEAQMEALVSEIEQNPPEPNWPD